LRIDAVKALQQRWQAQAHRVPMDRRQEQKLWDAFRKPIDDAFNRKTADREKAEAALGARDRMVLQAAKALDAANASGDAQTIRAAMAALEAALQGQAQAQADVQTAGSQESEAKAAVQAAGEEQNAPVAPVDTAQAATETVASDAVSQDAPAAEPVAETPAEPPAAPKAAPKRVVAARGDDRPGTRKESPAPVGGARPGKWGDRNDAARGPRDRGPARPDSRDAGRPAGRLGAESRGRPEAWQDAPRLGDAAFRAQRDALEHAQQALKKLAMQAHGEALTQLLTAWEKRDASLLPGAQDLGNRATPATRSAWLQALGGEVKGAAANKPGDPQVALLRLEMAAEVPTPAEDLDARRSLQLQLLTRRNDPPPAQTWGHDTASVLAGPFSAPAARRVQNVLKVLLKK
jgi:hypothetical protein